MPADWKKLIIHKQDEQSTAVNREAERTTGPSLKASLEKSKSRGPTTQTPASDINSLSQVHVEINPAGNNENATPEEITKQFTTALAKLQEHMQHPELVGQSLRYIMLHIRKHPFLADNIMPEDIGLIVRAVRENYGRVLQKKEKSSTQRSEKKQQDKELYDSLDQALEF